MLKRFIIILAAIGLLTTCHDSSNNNQNGKPDDPNNPNKSTFIVFDNTQGICDVSVYDDYRRRDNDKIAEIPSGKNSVKIGWTPGDSVPFYFSYAVTLKGISGFILNYVPETGRDQKTVRIDADTTTTIKVPTLSETFSSSDILLSNNSYLFIQNNSSYSFELHQGTSKLKPDNISSFLVNNGERAQYTINPGSASNYRLLVGADYKEFSGSIVNFDAGHIYIFDYNGSISLVKDTELKLENVNGFAVPQSPAAPLVITSNSSIALQWTAVESATAYEIWMATINDSASASKYGADVTASLSTTISGLNNGTTYYFWLKAKNNLGTSGFSPVAFGKPSAATVKPPDPQTAPSIITGNGQLTVSWQAVDQADVYEIWAWTTNNTQTAIKRGEEVSGLSTVITGLINGTTYYVWIKAKNDIGVSGFSPSATGKPLGIPETPTVSPVYKGLLVTWTAVAGAEQYEVYYGISTPTTLATTTTSTTATISGLTGGTSYFVRLRAKNANGYSDYGPSASGVPESSLSPGLYRGEQKIGTQNLTNSLTYISSNAVNGDEYYIVLGADESISPKILDYSSKSVGITLLGYVSERTLTLNANGSMFTVNSGVTLTFDENITLIGRSTNNASIILVYGDFVMNKGAKITENNYISSNGGNGGAVCIYNTGTFIMNGGIITGNTASSSNSSYGGRGGGVCMSGGNFILNSGEISCNIADYGGGIYVSNGILTMNGGKIKGNTARGGGIYISGVSGSVNMKNGIINGNNSNSQGGGIEVSTSGSIFTMNGGIISGNNAKTLGGGIYVDSGIFRKIPLISGQNSGIIYGTEAVGIDEDGIQLKNTSGNYLHFFIASNPYRYRNYTAWETDQIDNNSSKGLSLDGYPPYW